MTSTRVEILAAADEDIDDHAAYLAHKSGLDVGSRFLEAVVATFEKPKRFPASAVAREFRNPTLAGMRSIAVRGLGTFLIDWSNPASPRRPELDPLFGSRTSATARSDRDAKPRSPTAARTLCATTSVRIQHHPTRTKAMPV